MRKVRDISLLSGLIDFVSEVILIRRVKKIDFSYHIQQICESHSGWEFVFRDIEENSLASKKVLLSQKRALLDPLSGVSQFYFSLAALYASQGHKVEMLVRGNINQTVHIAKNFTLVIRAPNLRFSLAFPGGSVGQWRKVVCEHSSLSQPNLIIGPNVAMEFDFVGETIRTAVTLHTDWTSEPKKGNRLRYSRRKWMVKYYKNNTACNFYANSTSHLNTVKPFLPLNSRIKLVPHVALSVPSSGDDHFKSVFGKYVLFLGKLDRRKGGLPLVRIWNECNSILKDWNLLLVGPHGTESKSIQRIVSGKSNLHILGPVNLKTKTELLAQANFVIVPSFYESFSLVGAEALDYGVPVIYRDIPSLRETIGGNGIPFKTDKDLQFILSNLDVTKPEFPISSQQEYRVSQFINVWSSLLNS